MTKCFITFVSLVSGLLWVSPGVAGQFNWHAEGNVKWAELELPKEGKTGFTQLAPERTGIHFTNRLDEWSSAANRVLENGSGAAVGDFDGDGRPDIFLCSLTGRNALYRNLGDWKFEDVTLQVGVSATNYICRGAVFADIDGQGHFRPLSWTGGRFLDETGKPLAAQPLDWGLATTFRDLNGDGFPDLYVCNDYWTPDRVWINDGKGVFRAIDRLALRHTSENSMGVDFADIDRDGRVDFLVLDMLSRNPGLRKTQMAARTKLAAPAVAGEIANRPQIMRNTLFHNCGDGVFEEIADFAGVSASDWSWQPVFVDVDLD